MAGHDVVLCCIASPLFPFKRIQIIVDFSGAKCVYITLFSHSHFLHISGIRPRALDNAIDSRDAGISHSFINQTKNTASN